MNTPSTFSRSTPRAARAASLRQVVGQRIRGWLGGMWSALEASGQRQAVPYLLRQSRLVEGDNPTLAAALRALARPNARLLLTAATAAGSH